MTYDDYDYDAEDEDDDTFYEADVTVSLIALVVRAIVGLIQG